MTAANDKISPPLRGQLIRDYQFVDALGNPVMLSDFRGKANLILVVWPGPLSNDQLSLLRSLQTKAARLREYETQAVIVVESRYVASMREFADGLLILAEKDDTATRELAAPAIYVTDKFREVFHKFHGMEKFPSADDLVSWVEFVAMQCPECHPSEWPAVE